MDKQVALIAFQFKENLKTIYGNRLNKLLLFGSYARGNYRQDSDIDFMVVLEDEQLDVSKEIKAIVKAKHPLMLKYSKDISSIPISKNRFQTDISPLLYFVRREGVEI